MFGKILAAALAVSLFHASAAQAADDCVLKQLASLPITTTSTGKIAVPVKIAGHDALMAVELGSDVSGINANFMDELKLSSVPNPLAPDEPEKNAFLPGKEMFVYSDDVFTKGNAIPIPRKVTLPELQIGAFKIEDLAVTALPGWTDPDGIVGILGTSVLRAFDVEFDFANAKMNVYLQGHCGARAVYWASEYTEVPITINSLTGETMVPVTLDGVPLTATLSTDPGHSFMSFEFAAKALNVSIYSPDFKPIQHPDPPEGRKWFSYPFKVLSLGGLGLQNPLVDLDSNDECWRTKVYGDAVDNLTYETHLHCKSDITVELPDLKHFHLYFAYGEKMLYLTAADAHR